MRDAADDVGVGAGGIAGLADDEFDLLDIDFDLFDVDLLGFVLERVQELKCWRRNYFVPVQLKLMYSVPLNYLMPRLLQTVENSAILIGSLY